MKIRVMRQSCVDGEQPCEGVTAVAGGGWEVEVWSLTEALEFIAEHGEGDAHIYAAHEHYGCPVIEFRDA